MVMHGPPFPPGHELGAPSINLQVHRGGQVNAGATWRTLSSFAIVFMVVIIIVVVNIVIITIIVFLYHYLLVLIVFFHLFTLPSLNIETQFLFLFFSCFFLPLLFFLFFLLFISRLILTYIIPTFIL